MVKVLHIITGLDGGGAEKVVYDLCRKTNLVEFTPSVISLSSKNRLEKIFIDEKINTTILGMRKSLSGFLRALVYIRKYIKRNKIKVVHAHMTHSMIICAFLKILTPGIQIVFTSHSFNVGTKKREAILFILKLFRNIDVLFSESMKNFYYKKKQKIIPNGIEADGYNLNLKKNDIFTFIMIGRLEYVKNHILTIKCVNRLKRKFDFQVLFVGDGTLRKELEKEVSSLGLNENVKFLGFRTDIAEICNRAHVFLLPSHWEGLPISLLEAGASGLLVVSNAVGSIPDVINEQTGVLTNLNNFCDKIEYVLNNYSSLKQKGDNLKFYINSHYDISKTVALYEDVYRELAES